MPVFFDAAGATYKELGDRLISRAQKPTVYSIKMLSQANGQNHLLVVGETGAPGENLYRRGEHANSGVEPRTFLL